MLAGRGEFLVFKRWDKSDKGVMLFPPSLGVQPERQVGQPRRTFDRFSMRPGQPKGRVVKRPSTRIIRHPCTTAPVISQTEYEQGDYRALLEYPVKVVNFSERERYYQVDKVDPVSPDLDNPARSLLKAAA